MLTSRFGTGYGMGYSAFKEAQEMANAGHELTVVHSNNNISRYKDPRIEFIYISIKKTPFIDFIFFRRALKRIFTKRVLANSYDVIYIQSLEFGVMDFSNIKKPVFYFARSTIAGMDAALKREHIKISFIKRFINIWLIYFERRCIKKSKRIFVKSTIMAKELHKLYSVDINKIHVIRGGIDLSDFSIGTVKSCSEFKRKHNLTENLPIILFAGRIVPQKGLIYLIKAVLRLLDDYKFMVVIAGIGEAAYTDNINNLIKIANHQADFRFMGHVAQQEMPLLLNIADCVVTPSLYEPFGMINLQAASMGKTIITTNVVGSLEVLNDYAFLRVIKPGSVDALYHALEMCMTKERQPTRLIDFDDLSWKSVAQEIMHNFQSQVSQTRKSIKRY